MKTDASTSCVLFNMFLEKITKFFVSAHLSRLFDSGKLWNGNGNQNLHKYYFHRLKLHQEKEKSHATKSTIPVLEKTKIDTSIEYVLFNLFPHNAQKFFVSVNLQRLFDPGVGVKAYYLKKDLGP